MRNPLHYSAELLVKRAATNLNIPTYTAPLAAGPAMSDAQISAMLQNIQSYPEEQQQQILDTINQEYGNSGYRGGLVGSALGNIGNYALSAGNTLQQGINWASQNLFGKKPFDVQDSDRYRAETVLRTAATDPQMMGRISGNMKSVLPPPAAPPTTAKPTTPPPTAKPTTPPPAATPTTAKPTTPPPTATPPAATPTTAKPTTPPPAATPPAATPTTATPTTPPPAATPPAATPTTATPTTPPPAAPAAPAEEKFDPKWSPAEKEQYIKGKYGETTRKEKVQSKRMSDYYNPKPPDQTTDRWGRQLPPQQTDMQQRVAQRERDLGAQAKQQQWNYVNSGAINALKKEDAATQRDLEAKERGQARIKELKQRYGNDYFKGNKEDFERYTKGIY